MALHDLDNTRRFIDGVRNCGAKVALDRRLLQELKDPFIHLVRNAVAHGLEKNEERYAAGNLRDVHFHPEELARHAVRTYHPGDRP